jgi:hypothetical protein
MRVRLLVCVLLVGLLLGCSTAPTPEAAVQPPESQPTPTAPGATATPSPQPTATPEPTATPTPTPTPPQVGVRIPAEVQQGLDALGIALPETLAAEGRDAQVAVVADGEAAVTLALTPLQQAPAAAPARYLAAVSPFRGLRDEVTSAELAAAWAGDQALPLIVDPAAVAVATALWGAPAEAVTIAPVEAALLAEQGAIGLLGFDQLEPTLKVLRVDGQDVLSNQFDPASYPLAVALVAEGEAEVLTQLDDALAAWANRDAERLTQLVMTGVTAMCRLTAAKMEERGYTYPAEIVGPVLRQADITHVSNEVPFVKGCPVNASSGNLTFCSDYTYWQALAAVGADIIGLSGNHVNDYGYDGALESLAYYQSLGVPVYGSGVDEEAACEPLLWEDHGNTFAFIAALAFDPQYAWATADKPGACYYYHNKERILDRVRQLSAQVDVVSVELQYYETYHPFPTAQQVVEFRELRSAGADLVTGVQSHVPQAWEPYGADDEGGPGMILYGLGNLFFDQMWSWETRTGLIARHTVYEGRLLSSEILTTVLEDSAQPRGPTPQERLEILERVHGGAPAMETSQYESAGGMAVYAVELALHGWLQGEYGTAAYWGLDTLTDAAFADDARGGRVVSTRWQVVAVQPTAEVQQVIIAFRDTNCQLDGVEYAYPETHLAAARVTVEGDVVQIRELGPWRPTNPGA